MIDASLLEESDTKTRILNVAEALFAKRGFKQTSISLLAKMASVNQAAVNYHFGSKDALIEKVVKRRLSQIHDLRMKNLTEVQREARKRGTIPDLEALIRAFIEPTLRFREDKTGADNLMMIAGRAVSELDMTVQKIFDENFKPGFLLFSQLMGEVFPDMPKAELRWRIYFIFGILSQVMQLFARIAPVPDYFPSEENPDTLIRRMIAFMASGVNAPCPEGGKGKDG